MTVKSARRRSEVKRLLLLNMAAPPHSSRYPRPLRAVRNFGQAGPGSGLGQQAKRFSPAGLSSSTSTAAPGSKKVPLTASPDGQRLSVERKVTLEPLEDVKEQPGRIKTWCFFGKVGSIYYVYMYSVHVYKM